MERSTNERERCAAMVAALNAELGWHLGADQQQTYVSALLQYLPDSASETELRRLAANYHQDHEIVHALQDRERPQHNAVWARWSEQALRILQRQGLWSADALAEIEDLAQIALEELAHALPSFRYASRFSTWAYAVISRRAQRYLRERGAAKRSGPTESLDQREEWDELARDDEGPETQAEAGALAALIDSILAEQPDPRLALIFHLWASQDQRLVDIGRRVGLSPSRVSVLIEQTCRALRENPRVLAWLNDTAPDKIE